MPSLSQDLAARAAAALEQLGLAARPHQVAAWRVQEEGRDLLYCAATGSGKSMGYQAAAYASPGSLTVVVQPLVELIKEQTGRSHALNGTRAC